MGVLLGLVVAVSYGAADFYGGLATKRIPAAVAVAGTQLVGLAGLLVVLVLSSGHELHGADALRGAGAGLAGATALGLLYRGLAHGVMSVVAPITAAGAAIVPFAWGVVHGERPTGFAVAGAALAVVGIAVVARPPGPTTARVPPTEVALAVVAGIGFGSVFVLLGEASADAGLWPVVAARLAATPLAVAVALLRGSSLASGAHPHVLVAGVLDGAANGTFLAAARRGLLSEVAVVSALYPAATLLLARVVLGERVSRTQAAGLVAVLAGVLLIAA